MTVIGGEVTTTGGFVGIVASTGGLVILIGFVVGMEFISIGAGVTGTRGGEEGLGVVGVLSPRLTSSEVPSTLEIVVTHGSSTTPAAPAYMQKMASNSPLSAAVFSVS